MSVDAIGDFLTVIRNGLMASKSFVTVFHSKTKEAMLRILKDEGFIKDFVVLDAETKKKRLKVFLKYAPSGESVIHSLKRVSKLGCRQYTGAKVPPVIDGLGISILSSNHGIISNKDARRLNVGGEILCTVW